MTRAIVLGFGDGGGGSCGWSRIELRAAALKGQTLGPDSLRLRQWPICQPHVCRPGIRRHQERDPALATLPTMETALECANGGLSGAHEVRGGLEARGDASAAALACPREPRAIRQGEVAPEADSAIRAGVVGRHWRTIREHRAAPQCTLALASACAASFVLSQRRPPATRCGGQAAQRADRCRV